VSTVESARRVALLARPGAARDCVRAALLDVGADLVAEDDPTSADPQAVRAASPQVLMIVLDAAAEDALGRFDGVIGDPGIEVMFEEADVAVSREGWEAARWRRHLAAKLHHSGDVLPPVAETDVPAVDALSVQIEELIAVDAEGGEFAPAVDIPADAEAGQDFSVFDPVAAEGGEASAYTLGVEGLEFDSAAFDAPSFDSAAFDPAAFEAAPTGAGPFSVDDAAVLPPVTGPDFSASDFDPLLAELDAELPEPAALVTSSTDWNDGLVEGFGESLAAPTDEAASMPSTFGELSLADDAPAAPVRAAIRPDLDDLERRISGLQLVDDAPPAPGVVLVMAGLGGPDAVRQFLGALPAEFPCPVLVRQRLDGARYDKLVAQMQRATQLPVALAEAGRPVAAGAVYVVGDDIGLDASSGLRFASGAGLLDALTETGAVVLLSGSDPADVDRVAALGAQGVWLGAQASDGCYDPSASEALASRGAVSAAPAELARQVARRWSS
jgi:chemosensory pili system protein ChpB (putative protein-glutamate methylesterase)